MAALEVWAGPRALQHLRDRGLRPRDVGVVPGAAGGPKGLVLNPLDRFLFGRWLEGSTHPLHLLGASIGAWRLACACLPDADAVQLLGDLPAGVEAVVWNGEADRPATDIPGLLRMYKDGQIKLDELIPARYPLDDINQGFKDLKDGKNLRGVLVHDHAAAAA